MSRNRKKKAVPDDFISFEDIDFDVDFLFDEIPNDEDLPTCDEQSNDDTIGQTEVEDEIETTTYLRKPGKSTYYSTSSYRPKSLTCIMCKLRDRPSNLKGGGGGGAGVWFFVSFVQKFFFGQHNS